MNRGAVETRKALARKKLSINKGAELVGTDSGTFSKILREDDGRKPGRALAARIAAQFGIKLAWWDEPATDPEKPQKSSAA